MLKAEDLHAAYGSIVALRGVSIEVAQGELVALVGANGAGKTTVLSTIAGALRPRRGEITLRGTRLTGAPPERVIRSGIALVPENRDIFPALTVEENLRLGAYIRRNRTEFRSDVERMVDLFPVLGRRLHQPGGTLSGGEQQQLAIARALMSHPSLLMLDEPSLGLAPAIVDQVFDLIARLHAEGMTILLVEQNVNRTLEMVDRAYLLNSGRVEVHGRPQEILDHVDVENVYLGR